VQNSTVYPEGCRSLLGELLRRARRWLCPLGELKPQHSAAPIKFPSERVNDIAANSVAEHIDTVCGVVARLRFVKRALESVQDAHLFFSSSFAESGRILHLAAELLFDDVLPK
jgi:hypothetical protein